MKTARIRFGTRAANFKIGCAYRIRRSRAARTGPHAIHIHMDMTAIPHFLEIGIETVSMYAMEKSTVTLFQHKMSLKGVFDSNTR